MTMEQSIGASSRGLTDWQLIDWVKVRQVVRRLQLRIAKAIRAVKHGRARALQWLLTHSLGQTTGRQASDGEQGCQNTRCGQRDMEDG